MTLPPPEPATTRDRLLAAAIDEFSAVGFAGARVDAIAKKAGCNKQLLYHHFHDKEGLYTATLRAVLAEKAPMLAETLAHVVDVAHERFEKFGKERRWIRMLEWEALERGDQPVIGADERRCHIDEELARVRALQDAGAIRSDLPAELLMLQMMGLAMLPSLLPQLVTLLTGRPADEAFEASFATSLRGSLARLLAPAPPKGA